ncbi:4-oxalocrotonate tautomerase [Oceanisphaera psychrotolerans]|uniref:4-oxalocrotonate tautomerase n=1 Tax=Oceanisphaera psychrotolerans TaxID=1414654 RepID=UPI0009F4C1A8|nr:4-oxalocrotonate tautomerase [Oceanisphaera psychrotolerans]
MPIVRVELCPGRTQEQKARFVSEVTRLTEQTLNCPYESIDVIFTEVAASDWAHSGRFYSSPNE